LFDRVQEGDLVLVAGEPAVGTAGVATTCGGDARSARPRALSTMPASAAAA
jgi:hypothetical protein